MVRGGAPFGKGDGGIRKNPSLMGKSDASECNESSLSNCRVQLALSTRKDGMIFRNSFANFIRDRYNLSYNVSNWIHETNDDIKPLDMHAKPF